MSLSREEKIAVLKNRDASQSAPSVPLTREEKIAKLKELRDSGDKTPSTVADTALQGFGNGAAFGYAPELQAIAEKPLANLYDAVTGSHVSDDTSDDYVERRDAWSKRQADLNQKNPGTALVSNLAGGIASGIATGPLLGSLGKVAPAATTLGKVGQAARAAGRIGAVYGAVQNPGNVEGVLSPLQLEDRIEGAGKGALFSAAIPVGLEGAKQAGRGASAIANAVKTGTSENAPELIEAAKRLGIELTPGMTSDSMAIRGLESSLEQSPTMGGSLMRRATGKVKEGVQGNIEGLLSEKSSLSPDEVGRKIKDGMLETVDGRLQPHRETFSSLRDATQEIGLNPKSISRVAGDAENPGTIGRLRSVDLGLSGSDEASALAERLQKAKSVDDIKLIRSDLGRKLAAASSASDPSAPLLSELYKKVTSLEESNLLRQGVAQARAGGASPEQAEEATRQLLQDLRGAKKGFAGVSNDLRDFASESSLPKWAGKSPELFTSAIDGLQNEKVARTLFDTGNVQGLQQFAKQFPNEFDVARRSYLSDLASKAEYKGAPATNKFLGALKDMQPEVRKMIFGGEGAEKLTDLKTLANAIPEKIGASGTPQGLEFHQSWRPDQQAASLLNYGAYRAMTSGAAQSVADKAGAIGKMVSKSPVLQKLQQTNPAAFSALFSRIQAGTKFTPQEDDEGARQQFRSQN